MTAADDEVVAGAKQGDPAAWRALYRAHAGRLVVWLSTRPVADTAVSADDLAAEAWLTAAEKIGSFHGTSSDFAGWLFGIARKLGANAHRRGLRRGTRPTDPVALPDPPAVAGPEAACVADAWVLELLGTLPTREREVVACREVVGLDVAATASALGISSASVRVAHHRALRRLSTRLGAQLGSSERSAAR
ncbi:RNA polymerase sigma factor [Nocardioides sp.]|uniref:RNA polymerase sigma factor n=1 Tax=Nocardioides sp. TaxID=35761 RepID=UPI0037839676